MTKADSTDPGTRFLALLTSIRRAPGHEGDYAPHKPLMLLLALARAQRGQARLARFEEVEPVLKSLLTEFARSGAVQTRHLPYWRLKNDHDGRLWQLQDATRGMDVRATDPPTLTALRASSVAAGFPEEIADATAKDPGLIVKAARAVLDSNFPETLHEDIAQAIGLDLHAAEPPRHAAFDVAAYGEQPSSGKRRRRDPAFRDAVLRAYEYRCCVCGFDLRVGHIPVGLEAAHIQWHTVGGPDEVSNGLSLCALHHKLFDLGAFTVEPAELRVVFSYSARYQRTAQGLTVHRELIIRHPQRVCLPETDRQWHEVLQVIKRDLRAQVFIQ